MPPGWGGLRMDIALYSRVSMIVDIVHVLHGALLEPEGNPPIAGDPYRPMPLQVAFRRVQPEPRQVHVIGSSAAVQHRQDISQLLQMLWRHPSRRPSVVERFQAPMPERPDHRRKLRASPVACQLTRHPARFYLHGANAEFLVTDVKEVVKIIWVELVWFVIFL